jgi:hypothetical protein
MTAEEVENHGLIMCVGDQLTISLVDKVGVRFTNFIKCVNINLSGFCIST